MDPSAELVAAAPIRDVHVRAGVFTNCGGVAQTLADFEQAPAFEVVSVMPPLGDDQELTDFCATNLAAGVEAELRELFGEPPAVRVVLRATRTSWVDANESITQRCGRYLVREAVRRAGLGTALAVSEAAYSERVLDPPR